LEEFSQEISIHVMIKEKIFIIYCGEGRQKVRWLTDNAIFKYEALNKTKCGKLTY